MTMHSKINIDQVLSALDFDECRGVFYWKICPNGFIKIGDVAGGETQDGYLQIRLFGKYYKVHRLAYAVAYGVDPDGIIDHRDGDKKNNRPGTLRLATSVVNAQNRHTARVNSKSNLLGAFWRSDRQRWSSSIMVDGKRIALGTFATDVDAHNAYIKAKRKLHEGCTL